MTTFTCPACSKEWSTHYCPECARTIAPEATQPPPPTTAQAASASASLTAPSAPNSKQSSVVLDCAGNFRIVRADAGNPSHFKTIASTRGGVTKGNIHFGFDAIVLHQKLSPLVGILMFIVSWIGISFLTFLPMLFSTKMPPQLNPSMALLTFIAAILIPVFVAWRTRRFERRFLFSNIITADISSGKLEIEFSSGAKRGSTGAVRNEQHLPAIEKLYFSPHKSEQVDNIVQALAAARVEIRGDRVAEEKEFRKQLTAATPHAWVTPTLLALNVLVFLLMGASDFHSWLAPSSAMLIRWGGSCGPLTITDQQWWRLLTGCFVHSGVWHLCFNMVALYLVGRAVERLLGNWFFLAVYLGCGLVASLTSLYFHPDPVSVGASGAIFGVYGALLGFIARQRETLPRWMAGDLMKFGATFVGYNMVYGLQNYFFEAVDRINQNVVSHSLPIDQAAHAGGLVAGLVFGFMAARPLDLGTRQSATAQRSIALTASLVVLAGLLSVPVIARGIHNTANFLKLASIYYNGEGVVKNPKMAVRWVIKAAEQGDLSSQSMLGWSFYRGDDAVERDVGTAVQWFTKAGEAGDVKAESILVRIYFTGEGVATNYAEGIKWLTKLADQGADQDFNELERVLAKAYLQGDGVPKNDEAALKWLTRVAERGDTEAKNQLARGIHAETAEAYYKSAGMKFRSRDLDGAIADYGKAIELKPDYTEAYRYRGNANLEKHNWAGAITDFNKFIELNPDFASAYIRRAFAKLNQSDFEGAIADYSKAIELKPDDMEAYTDRGYAKLRKGNLDGAITDCTRAAALKPDNAPTYSIRADAENALGDLDAAIADYTRAIELKPDSAENYLNRGLVMQTKGDFDGAIADFTKAIELKPDYFYAYNNRGNAKQSKGDLDGAIADSTRAIQLNLSFGYAYGSRGWAHYAKGEITPALEDFEKAVELQDVKSAAAFEHQGMIDFINGDYGKAVRSWEVAAQKDGLLTRKLGPWIEKAKAKQMGNN